MRLRRATGRATVGLKVGFANKAMWRVLKLETLGLGAHVRRHGAPCRRAIWHRWPTRPMFTPKIEPEIVFGLKRRSRRRRAEAASPRGRRVARARFRDHRLRVSRLEVPAGRLRASRALHGALVRRGPAAGGACLRYPRSSGGLTAFTVELKRDGQLVAEGREKTRSGAPPCAWAAFASRPFPAGPVPSRCPAGKLVSSGTLTESRSHRRRRNVDGQRGRTRPSGAHDQRRLKGIP